MRRSWRVQAWVLVLALWGLVLPAWALDGAQLLVLKTAMFADPYLDILLQENRYPEIAAYYNDLASTPPTNAAYWVWRSGVPPEDYVDALVGTEVVALTAGQARAFDWITGQQTRVLDAGKANVRQTMIAAFQTNAPTTLANLTALGKREATRGERLYTTGPGTGTVGSPATLTWEGDITVLEVSTAASLP